jgi:hypothetical protein
MEVAGEPKVATAATQRTYGRVEGSQELPARRVTLPPVGWAPRAPRAELDQSRAFGLERGHALVAHEPGAGSHVEVHPVLDDPAFGNLLEEQGAHA